jgi:hypothetical protein
MSLPVNSLLWAAVGPEGRLHRTWNHQVEPLRALCNFRPARGWTLVMPAWQRPPGARCARCAARAEAWGYPS